MEENKTVQYKRTLRDSVGAGMGALFNGSGRKFYILEHRDGSKYHKVGESQKIIIDQIELGCNPNCQVRFDQETWGIVSRRHAAIQREGDQWKLIQLSKVNSTLVNGHKIEKEWFLKNGDEIQLAVGGPRLGFIVNPGKQSLVSSIKLAERLKLFEKQALRPYKRAIAALFATLIVLSCIAGYVIKSQGMEIKDLLAKSEIQDKLFADAKEKWKKDSIDLVVRIGQRTPIINKHDKIVIDGNKELVKAIDAVKPSIYAVITTVYFESSTEKQKVARSQGTGFLLSDGRFVTARHCVEPWLFNTEDIQLAYAISNASDGNLLVYAEIMAINCEGKSLNFKDTDFRVDSSADMVNEVPYEIDGESVTLPGRLAFSTKASLGNDWAYAKVSKKGNIIDGSSISASLKGGTSAHLLGFPQNLGIMDGSNIVDPIYNNVSISRDGLNDARCIMISHGVDHGNSGGPVFVMDNSKLVVIGIVSRGDVQSDMYNHLVPMSNLR